MATLRGVSLRKRQQIEHTGKIMFTWVALAAAIVAIAAVISLSLFERMMFNQKVLDAKGQTVAHLKNNNDIVSELRSQVGLMNVNTSLEDTPRTEGSEPLSVVLDALPYRSNAEALGASLQQKLLNPDGVKVESLEIDPESMEASAAESTDNGKSTMNFAFQVSASNPAGIKEVLDNLERSIRVFNPQNVSIEWLENRINLSVEGVVYFAPAVQVELKNKPISPSGAKQSVEKVEKQ